LLRAYVKETLEESVKQLKQIMELVQKPFGVKTLINIIEDKDVYSELQRLNVDVDIVKAINPTHEQVIDLLERLQEPKKVYFFVVGSQDIFLIFRARAPAKIKLSGVQTYYIQGTPLLQTNESIRVPSEVLLLKRAMAQTGPKVTINSAIDGNNISPTSWHR
jgi:hypothetical protein